MRYDDFKETWGHALRESGLAYHGEATEELDLRSMARSYEVFLAPAGPQDAEPFYVTAKLSWNWDSLQSARTATNETDMVTELFGPEARLPRTEKPWLRVDISLNASLMYGKAIPLPPPTTWASWAREAVGRLENIERLLPEEVSTDGDDGFPRILAWQSDPSLEVTCTAAGELKLSAVRIEAWQAVTLPRVEDGADPKEDDDPSTREQLHAMFRRVRASLRAWMEVMDHLSSRPQAPLR